MMRSVDRAAHHLPWRRRAVLAGLLLAILLVLTAAAPAAVFAPRFESAIVGPRPSDQAIVNQADPEAGITLMSAVFNALEDRFFRPLDSRDLLDAAWDGATRGLAQQRRQSSNVAAPQFTGDRTSDLAAFTTQYRALLAAAESNIDANKVAMAASDGMAQSVDEQHTYFLAPDEFARYTALLTSDEGRVGLGISIQGPTAPFTIQAVVPGAPAEKAGVMPGDQIESVNGQSVASLDLNDLSDLLVGEEGQPVTLTLRRGDTSMDLAVVRARFSEPPLTMRVLPEGVCYLKLTTFPISFSVGPTGRTIGQELDYDLEQCEQAGVKGWIMDLRGNGGGNAISEVLGRFMDAGPIMIEKDRDGNRYESATDGHLFRVQHPLVTLIDDNSASASEVFASAVQEYKRAVVMGRRSAGALNTTTIVSLPLGAGMGVTIRQVFTGVKEVVVDGVGVTPDVSLRGGDPAQVPPEAIQAALNPPPGVGPLTPGPSPTDGLLSDAELKRRVDPVLLKAGDAEKAEDQVEKGDLALDTYQYYASDNPDLNAARDRAIRLGWLGVYARWIGADFPPPFSETVSLYKTEDGAHRDLQEIYDPGEPHNPPQWKQVDAPVSLGDETLAQVGIGENDGRIWISWRRGAALYTVSRNVSPGEDPSFDSIARLAQIVDQRAQANPPSTTAP
jgi:carboxyl-terminal processing protease